MSHVHHALAEEFPDKIAVIHDLKKTDPHFQKLADTYRTLNRAVHRAEMDIEPTSDDHLTQMRRQRVWLKDERYKELRLH